MKKLNTLFAASALVALVGFMSPAFAKGSVVVSSTTALDTVTPPLRLTPNESATWTVVGNATGTIHLQKSLDMTNWEVQESSITRGTINWSGKVQSDSRAAFYRFRVSTITAGVYATEIRDVNDFVSEIKNHKGLPTLTVYDDTVEVTGQIEGFDGGVPVSTAITSGNSVGQSFPAYLGGFVPAVEGSLLIATTPVAGQGTSVIVAPATLDLTSWLGVARRATSTGTVVDVYYSGTVLALSTGTVLVGNVLVSTPSSVGYLGADSTPTSGADVGVALSSGTAAGSRIKIRLR